jgi:hypothetical protein
MCLPRRIWRLLFSSKIANTGATSEHVLLSQGCCESVHKVMHLALSYKSFHLDIWSLDLDIHETACVDCQGL